ncbi:IclR family transcriptional regulator [Mesorhizobium sp. YR577]|uniref:IclR family transcriptional regulator n=1 Tax=Mesorhizobium sp. YR577 TaxID=1884373 RepID=UPI0008F11D5F|nr:IclR family transcriptional regulator [Mesorhizobium sp. YR577]SFU19427.1 transcriptional regulator, IclR family [Mesorhizobium sp. YR577]
MSLVVEKTLKLIELVADGNQTLAGLIRESELSRSTTHRLLATLVSHGYLSYSHKRYELGFRFLEIGEKKKRSLGFVDILRPALHEYAEEIGDTLHIAILDGTDIILVERVSGRRELQIRSHVGQRAPAFRTAVGKALIGRRPANTWNAFLQDIPVGYPRKTSEVRADFENAKRRNFATDYDEVSLGTCGIASAFKINQSVDAAVSINGATVYFPKERMNELSSIIVGISARFTEIIAASNQH